MKHKQAIGFIGLGAMGLPMAKRLCHAGYNVITAVNRNSRPVEELENLGAIIKKNFIDVISNSDVIMTILPADKEVNELLLLDDVLKNIRPGTILIEMTTCSPKTVQEISNVYRELGVSVIDAPVSGGISGAVDGTLTLMVGGNTDILEKVRKILDEVASNIVIVGNVGAGKSIKMINQILVAINVLATSEAISLAKHLNVDLSVLEEVIRTSTGSSKVFHNKFEKIITENFEPGFRLRLMLKDVEIALKEGKDLILPLTTVTSQLFDKAKQTDGELDISAVSKLFSQ